MVDQLLTLDEITTAALRLSLAEKAQLLERVASALESDVRLPQNKPLKTFEGALAHLGPAPTDEDIAEARREMMRNFPRDDFDL